MSIPGQIVPFRVTVKTDDSEVTASAAADMADMNEQNGRPGGIVGFALDFVQQPCA